MSPESLLVATLVVCLLLHVPRAVGVVLILLTLLAPHVEGGKGGKH